MGTRGLMGFVVDGEEKLTYNHYDSYPGGLGVDVLNALKDDLLKRPDLRDQVRALVAVNDNIDPTDEERERYAKYADFSVSTGRDWYSLLRNAQGDLAKLLDAGAMVDSGSFALDSLFCEWGYVIDLDANVLEVYKGFQSEPPKRGRWTGRGSGDYKAIELVASWPLGEGLPTDEELCAVGEYDEVDA